MTPRVSLFLSLDSISILCLYFYFFLHLILLLIWSRVNETNGDERKGEEIKEIKKKQKGEPGGEIDFAFYGLAFSF